MAFQAHSTNRVLRVQTQSGFILSTTPASPTPAQLEVLQSPKHVNHTKSCYANSTTNQSLPTSAMPTRQSFPVSRPPRKDSSSSSTSCASTPTNCNSSLTGSTGHIVVDSNGSLANPLPHNCRSLQSPGDVLHNGTVPGGYAKANQKNEALLDRKAFISLEKSINWQALIDTYATNDPTEVIDNSELSSSAKLDNSSCTAPSSLTDSLTWLGKATVVTQTKEFTLSGMKDVPAWLKLLRLHKYSGLFAQMSYEQMLDLNENELENRNITKGARQKLVLSIQKLKVRSHVLLASELELIDVKSGGYRKWISLAAISQAFCQIRAFLSTPIRPPIVNPVPVKSPTTIPTTTTKGKITTSTIAVDANNNPFPQGTLTTGLDDKWAFVADNDNIDNTRLCELWLELDNEQLVNILTRMVGHLCHNLVTKCKKRLQNQNLWMKHFNEYYAMVEHEDFLKKIVLNLLTLKVDKSKVLLASHSKSEDDDDDDESSDSSSSPHSTDSGVEAGDSGDDRERHCNDGGDLYTCEKEETFFSELQMILDKCLEHDAFGSHSPLFGEWHSQLSIMRSALRNQIEKASSQAQASQQTVNHQMSQFMRTTPKNGHITPQQPELGGSLGQKSFRSTNNNNMIVSNQSHKSHHHHHHHHHPQQHSQQHSQHYHSQQPSLPLPLPQSTFQTFASFQRPQHLQQTFWSLNFNSNNLNAGHSHTPISATKLLRQSGVISSGREVGSHKLNNNSIALGAFNNNSSNNNVNKSILSSIVPINDYFGAFNPQWNSFPWIEKASTLEINGGSVWSPHTSHHVQTNREWSLHGSNLVSNTESNQPLSPTVHQSQWPSSTPMESDIERLCIQMAEDALDGTCLEDK